MGASGVHYVVLIKGRQVADIYDDLRSAALARSGYEYSGDLGSKSSGYRIVGHLPNATADDLRSLQDAIYECEDREEGDDSYVERRFPMTTICPANCFSPISRTRGKVAVKVLAKVRSVAPENEQVRGVGAYLPSKMMTGSQVAWVERDCRTCKGEGRVPLKGEARHAVQQARKEYERKRRALAGLDMRKLTSTYNDKWGPTAVVVGKDHVWVGGLCPS